MTFGRLDGGPWGAAWLGEDPIVLLAAPDSGAAAKVVGDPVLAGAGATEDWNLSGDGLELTVTAAAEPVHGTFGAGADGFDQLCRVHGSAAVDGSPIEVDCPGRRATRSGLDLARYQSIRDVSVWFDPGEGFALTALRPRKAKSQAKDAIVAAVLDAAEGHPVADPRLSTTYDSDGAPARVGLELWIDAEGDEQYPHRAAGEAVQTVSASAGATELRAALLRCHSHRLEGTGVYLLAAPAR